MTRNPKSMLIAIDPQTNRTSNHLLPYRLYTNLGFSPFHLVWSSSSSSGHEHIFPWLTSSPLLSPSFLSQTVVLSCPNQQKKPTALFWFLTVCEHIRKCVWVRMCLRTFREEKFHQAFHMYIPAKTQLCSLICSQFAPFVHNVCMCLLTFPPPPSPLCLQKGPGEGRPGRADLAVLPSWATGCQQDWKEDYQGT